MVARSVLDDPAFLCAFLAVGQLLGAPRSAAPAPALAPEVRELVERLASEDRVVRASAMARELEKVARRLDERRVA